MIEVQRLDFTYPGATVPAIRDLSFEVARREIFGFLGPSGAGKSTVQRVLIGLLHGWRGRARVLGRDLRLQAPDSRGRIGVSFELPNLYGKLTARENLEFFGSLYDRQLRSVEALLDDVGLGAAGEVRVGELSKGMKMRLNVCRALLHDPELLFLDEPTAGLDPVNAQRIKDIVVREREAGKTIFLTTHDMSCAAQLCDRVAFIVDGQIACIDSPRQLMMEHGRKVVCVEWRDGDRLGRREFPVHGLADDAGFLELLRGGRIETIHSAEASLDDVFIAVTGRRLQ